MNTEAILTSPAILPRTTMLADECRAAHGQVDLLTKPLELVGAPVGHQGQKEPAVLDYVRPHEGHLPDYAVVQRARRAHRARKRHRTELELIRSRGLPRSASAVAVDARAEAAV